MAKLVFDGIRFFQDHGIDYHPGSGEWVNIHCPFCQGSQDYHLGFNMQGGGWHCWRCGKKKLNKVIEALVGPIAANSPEIREKYRASSNRAVQTKITPKKRGSVKLPPGSSKEIPIAARKYLKKRLFDPDYLTKIWKLQFTGFSGPYKFRVIAPIYHRGRIVSYQGRDYTERAELRYKACKKEEETRNHQHCLYGEWLVKRNHIITVEGIADAWRLGPGAVALFGIDWTPHQAYLLAQYREVTIIFDSEEQAATQAEKLAFFLKTLKQEIIVNIIEIADGDPGELPQEEADQLMNELLRRK